MRVTTGARSRVAGWVATPLTDSLVHKDTHTKQAHPHAHRHHSSVLRGTCILLPLEYEIVCPPWAFMRVLLAVALLSLAVYLFSGVLAHARARHFL